MKVLLCFLLFFNLSIEKELKLAKLPEIKLDDFEERIFGGTEVKDGDLPYMVLVLIRTDSHEILRCSGSLFAKNLVLLAAHCLPYGTLPEDIITVAGKADLTSYMIARKSLQWNKDLSKKTLLGVQEGRGAHIHIHRNYNSTSYNNDLAIIRIASPFTLTEFVQTRNISRGKPNGLLCTISGWGETNGTIKGYRLVSADEMEVLEVGRGCLYKDNGDFYCLVKNKSGICKGDSGSPLICGEQILGVASHLLAYTNNPECGADYEEYYADVNGEDEFFNEASLLRHQSYPKIDGGKSPYLVASAVLTLILVIFIIFAT